MKINIHEFLKQFRKEYNFLYEHRDNVAGYREAVRAFDETCEKSESFRAFVREFNEFREDLITSNREAAAFMFALEVLS